MSKSVKWKCEVCGYIHEGENPPDSCPVCGAGKEAFTPFRAVADKTSSEKSEKWGCSVCGYESKGEKPNSCSVCGAGKDLFRPKDSNAKKSIKTADETLVVIGGGIAGSTAIQEARTLSQNTSIKLISDEERLPYYRLNLTRLLAGEISQDELDLKPSFWYEENSIELIYSKALEVDREAKKVLLSNGKAVSYDKLILANGSHPFVPPFNGTDKKGFFVVRTIEDVRNILEFSKEIKNCICIGGGLLGLETSGALKKRGLSVTVLEGFGWLLPRQLTKSAGLKLKEYMERNGIDIKSSVNVKEILGGTKVEGVRLEDENVFKAEMVVVSTGVRANTYLARKSGIKVNSGIIVDDNMQTSDKNIYAAGDVAEHSGTLYGIWPASYAQGAVAGINAVGGDTEFLGIPPSTRLKVLDVDVFSVGKVVTDDASYTLRETDNGDTYRFFCLRDGKILGAVLYGDTSLAQIVKDAVENKTQIANLKELTDKAPELNRL